jgi:3-methyladenine DNA glycosylase AlkD
MKIKEKTEQLLEALYAHRDPAYLQNVGRLGVQGKNMLGVCMPDLRKIARQHDKDHSLAISLWDSGIHEARILASMLDEVASVTLVQMEQWVQAFDSWDLCDQVCSNLFCRTPYAYDKALQWSERYEEFIKRAGFVMMAELAIHDKQAQDALLAAFFPIIEREAYDQRNYVKKALSWALRQIGKRNATLHAMALLVGERLAKHELPAARWVGKDVLKELNSEKVKGRLK